MRICIFRNCFSAKNPPRKHGVESYDYVQLERQQNRGRFVDYKDLKLAPRAYDFAGGGVSYNLELALGEVVPQFKKAILFALLLALDEQLKEEGGVDALEKRLIQAGVDSFDISEGCLSFFKEDEVALSFLIFPQRYQADLGSLWEDFASKKESLLSKTHQALQEISPRERAKEALSAPDNRLARPLPTFSPPPYYFSGQNWITSGGVPEGLAPEFRDQTRCSPYVLELARRDLGDPEGKVRFYKGLDRVDAWEWLAKTHFKKVASLQDKYLRISGGTIVDQNTTNNPQYLSDLQGLRTELLKYSKENIVALDLWNRFSNYKGIVAAYNRGRPLTERSLNTHKVYVLGKDFRPLEGPPERGETVAQYLQRLFPVGEPYRSLLKDTRVRIGEQIFSYEEAANHVLSPESQVAFEDLWVAHHYNGSKVTPFSQLVGASSREGAPKLVPGHVMAYPKEKHDQLRVVNDPLLNPVRVIHVGKGETLLSSIRKQVSPELQDWRLLKRYWALLGLDTSKIRDYLDPVPIPDLENLKKNADAFFALELDAKEEMLKRLEQEQKGLHLFVVRPGDHPWSMMEGFFSNRLNPPLSRRERTQVLAWVDAFNDSVDLRTYTWENADGEQTSFASFEAGAVIRLTDEEVGEILQQVQHEREKREVFVPKELPYPLEDGFKMVSFASRDKLIIHGVTRDPLERTLLILLLLNEAKGGVLRAKVAEQAEKRGIYKETTVGLFQILPLAGDLDWLKTQDQKYQSWTIESYREALKKDPRLNVLVALHRLQESRAGIDDLLRLNGEEEKISETNPDYIRAVLSCYNPSPADVHHDLFYNLGERIARKFRLGKNLENQPHESEMSWNPRVSILPRVESKRTISLEDYWRQVFLELRQKYPQDFPFLDQELDSALSKLMNNKQEFLQDPFYRKLKKFYKKEKGENISLLFQSKDYALFSNLNYGYRATRHDQLKWIQNYSASYRVINTPPASFAKDT